MNVYPIEAGNFKLDGGAMFGVVPKSLWTKTNPADADNMIEMSSRCMLVENSDKLILVDTGMGDKQSEKFFKYYKRWGNDNLVKSINSAGFSIDDVTDVLLTHLHFDHCGNDCNKELLHYAFSEIYCLIAPTVTNDSASSSGIDIPYSVSNSRTNSTVCNESPPKSSMICLSSVTSDISTFKWSAIIFSTDIILPLFYNSDQLHSV